VANTKGIRAGRAFVELGVDDRIARGLQKAAQRLNAFGEGLRSIGLKVFAAGSAIAAPLVGAVKTFADSGDALEKMSRRTGVSVEALSELGFAAEQSGADFETLETGLRRMQKSIVDAAGGSDGAVEALARLRLTVADLVNLSPEQQFKLIAERLSQVADPTLRAALAMEIFGKSGTKLIPLLEGGAAGIEAFQQQARDLGLTMSTDAAKKAALLNDTLNILWRVVKRLTTTIGEALADAVIDLADRITRVVVTVMAWVKQNQAIIITAAKVAAGVMAAGAALVVVGTLVSGLGAVFGVLASVVSGVGTVFGAFGSVLGALLNPIGLVVAAIAGLGTAILVYTGAGADALAWLGDTFRWLKDGVLKVIGGIADALAAGDLTLAAQVLWAGLKLAWETGIAPLRKAWNAFRYAFERIAIEAFAAVRKAWISVSTWMWKNFPETTAFIAKTWANLTAGLRTMWADFQNWLSDRWLDVMGLIGSLTDEEVAEAKRLGEEALNDRLVEIENKRQSDVAEAERKSKLTAEQHDAERDAALVEVERQRAEALKHLEEADAERAAAAADDLAQARKELDAAREAAQQKRAEAEAAAPSRRRLTDPLAGLEDQFADLGDFLARKITVTGTFNPLAAAGLGGGDAVERTAQNTEQIAKHTKRLADAAAVGRLSFA